MPENTFKGSMVECVRVIGVKWVKSESEEEIVIRVMTEVE